jgi:CRISPR-associated protein Csd1
MILKALYDLAVREGLMEDPDFEQRRVPWVIRIDGRGRFLGLFENEAKLWVPRQPKHTNRVQAHFLVCHARYVLGLSGRTGKQVGRDALCAAAFVQGTETVARDTQDSGALALLEFLKRRQESLPSILETRSSEEWSGSEEIAFAVDADGGRFVHERQALQQYWRQHRQSELRGTAASTRCLVTGQVSPPARLHGFVKRVPPPNPMGTALVSFNKEAFTSHSLEQGENAPISRSAAEGYVAALNYLLERTPSRAYRYGVRVGNEAVTVFWTREKNETPDLLAALLDPTEEEALATAESPWKGIEPVAADLTPFYALTLSGNAARLVVRDWFESTARAVKENLKRYFADLRLGEGEPRPLPIPRLLASLRGRGEGTGLSPDLGARLFRAALRGGAFPREIVGAALRRLRLDDARWQLDCRCALIKAALLRLPSSGRQPWEVTVSLDETNRQVPYLLGRLFAVLERLQGYALRDLNVTIRDRYFGSASATPALVFPRLLRLSVFHAAKAEGAGWLERIKGQVIDALPPEPFPRVLSLEQQGLFAIGYYHQREWFFRGKEGTAQTQQEV